MGRLEGPDFWLSGDYWNVDSNITKWGEHEIRRNLASASHDIHRHDQVRRLVLPPHPNRKDNLGRELQDRQCISGVVSPDANFLEAFGFDLGLRDRQGGPIIKKPGIAPGWSPVSKGEMFRSGRSYDRNVARLADSMKSMRRAQSTPGFSLIDTTSTIRREDFTSEHSNGGDFCADCGMQSCVRPPRPGRVEEDKIDPKGGHAVAQGKTHGSRSCRYWDSFDHTCKREAAKTSCATFSASFNSHPEAYPLKYGLELNPASVYTKKHEMSGESALRYHEEKKARPAMSRSRPWTETMRPSTAP